MAETLEIASKYRDAINNELHLIRYLGYSGLTALRRAEFQQLGSYFEAFFAITVSLERAAKLALALERQLQTGKFPTEKELRTYGHDLEGLEMRVGVMTTERKLALRWQMPDSALDRDVLVFLNDFASAGKDRYYNLNFLAASQTGTPFAGPPAKWMSLVAAHLSTAELRLTQREKAGVDFYAHLDQAASVVVHQAKEDGTKIETMAQAQQHFYLNDRVQRVGTLACIHHLRFLFDVLRCLGPVAGLDVWDYFVLLLNEDKLLRKRRKFA